MIDLVKTLKSDTGILILLQRKYCNACLYLDMTLSSFQVSTLHTVKTKRSIKPPFKSNAESLFVELVLVADTKVYERYQKNETRITNRFIEIVSVVNAVSSPRCGNSVRQTRNLYE